MCVKCGINSCGCDGKTILGGSSHYLGEPFGGGIIYYLYKDIGGIEHGLIVNKAETATVWQAVATTTNADRSWDGAFNTALMTDSAAATYVDGLADGGFTDWYLPSVDELNLLWDNRYSANKALSAIGGADLVSMFSLYWSSTEYSPDTALNFSFFNGNSSFSYKYLAHLTRAIRSF
jgi:hypothetical protein